MLTRTALLLPAQPSMRLAQDWCSPHLLHGSSADFPCICAAEAREHGYRRLRSGNSQAPSWYSHSCDCWEGGFRLFTPTPLPAEWLQSSPSSPSGEGVSGPAASTC